MALIHQIKIRELKPDRLKFDAPDNVEFLNTLKNIIKYEVPSLAVHEVIIDENNTGYSPGFLAKRIMLMPILSHNVSLYRELGTFPNDIMPDQDPTTGAILVCRVFNPKDAIDNLMVSSFDFQPLNPNDPIPIGEKIDIMPLRPGEEIKVRAIIRRGTGNMDINFSPVGISIFTPNTGSNDYAKLKDWDRSNPWAYTFEFDTKGTMPVLDIYHRALKIYAQKYPCITRT
jgi:hypothetical protein